MKFLPFQKAPVSIVAEKLWLPKNAISSTLVLSLSTGDYTERLWETGETKMSKFDAGLLGFVLGFAVCMVMMLYLMEIF